MSIREKLASILIGPVLMEARQDMNTYLRLWEHETAKTGRMRADIRAIRDSLTGQQSGTARRVRRMCEEALK